MFLTPKIIATEALRILQSNIVYRDLVYNDYSNEFAKVGDTVNVRKPQAVKSSLWDGTHVDVKQINEIPVPVMLDRIRDTSVSVTSKELSLDIVSFSDQVLKPVLIGMAQDVDSDIAAAVCGFAGSEVKATANPTDLKDLGALSKALDKNKAPRNDRNLVFAVDHKYNYALTDNLSIVSYAGDNQALREAILGRIFGMSTYMSQNNVDSIATEKGTATGFKVSGTAGNTHVALSTVAPSGGTVKAGEGFIFDGRLYRFTENQNAAGTDVARITIDEKLHKNITTNDVIYYVNKPVSVAFQKEGVAFVTRPMDLPMGVARAYVAQAENIAVRAVFTYDKDKKQDIISFDVLYGIAKLNDKLIVRLA